MLYEVTGAWEGVVAGQVLAGMQAYTYPSQQPEFFWDTGERKALRLCKYARGALKARTDHQRVLVSKALRHRFAALRKEWQAERSATSSITQLAMAPAYQKIIAMGEPAIPLILRQMESEGEEPDMWFWALRVLTDTDPITDDIRGDTFAMSRAWLGWARNRYEW